MNLISHGRDHAERSVPSYKEYLIIILLSSLNFFSVIIYLGPALHSRVIVNNTCARIFTTVTTYLYVLCQYSTYSRRQGSVGYTNQDCIQFYEIFHRENIKLYSLNIFPPKGFLLFYYTSYIKSQIRNHHCTSNIFIG